MKRTVSVSLLLVSVGGGCGLLEGSPPDGFTSWKLCSDPDAACVVEDEVSQCTNNLDGCLLLNPLADCADEFETEVVFEDDSTVRLRLEAGRECDGDEHSDSIWVALDGALNGRNVVDDTSGEIVPEG